MAQTRRQRSRRHVFVPLSLPTTVVGAVSYDSPLRHEKLRHRGPTAGKGQSELEPQQPGLPDLGAPLGQEEEPAPHSPSSPEGATSWGGRPAPHVAPGHLRAVPRGGRPQCPRPLRRPHPRAGAPAVLPRGRGGRGAGGDAHSPASDPGCRRPGVGTAGRPEGAGGPAGRRGVRPAGRGGGAGPQRGLASWARPSLIPELESRDSEMGVSDSARNRGGGC